MEAVSSGEARWNRTASPTPRFVWGTLENVEAKIWQIASKILLNCSLLRKRARALHRFRIGINPASYPRT